MRIGIPERVFCAALRTSKASFGSSSTNKTAAVRAMSYLHRAFHVTAGWPYYRLDPWVMQRRVGPHDDPALLGRGYAQRLIHDEPICVQPLDQSEQCSRIGRLSQV